MFFIESTRLTFGVTRKKELHFQIATIRIPALMLYYGAILGVLILDIKNYVELLVYGKTSLRIQTFQPPAARSHSPRAIHEAHMPRLPFESIIAERFSIFAFLLCLLLLALFSDLRSQKIVFFMATVIAISHFM